MNEPIPCKECGRDCRKVLTFEHRPSQCGECRKNYCMECQQDARHPQHPEYCTALNGEW